MATVSIIGAGAWGTALAVVANRAGSDTTIWSRNKEIVRTIAETGENALRLPGIKFDPRIVSTFNLEDACQANILVVAIPAQAFREVTTKMAPYVPNDSYVIIASKGIEIKQAYLMSEIAAQTLPNCSIAVLSGPSFADEVAMGLPTAVTLAAENLTKSDWLARSFNNIHFRVYPSEDIIGVQIGGALKNVLAIASGIIVGRRMGSNAQASLITRGLSELIQLAKAKGGRASTLSGLSGIGDICLTCYNEKSRNMSLGKAIALGKSVPEVIAQTSNLTEGIATSKTITKLSETYGIEMPICAAVDAILNQGADVGLTIEAILERPMRAE